MSPAVIRSDAAGVATLTLNRPDKLNAIDSRMFFELEAHLAALEAEVEEVGVVVLRGAGRCFSAGLDLADATGEGEKAPPLLQTRTVDRLSRLPQPVIAAVHGHCYTGALEFALAADIILAAASARFSDTHAKWGLTPAWGMSQRLPRRIGRGQAARMMFTGCPVGCEEALALGLVDVGVAEDRFEQEITNLAAMIAENSWFSHRGVKRLMRETEGLPLSAGLAYEFVNRPGRAPDFAERVARFTKR